MLINRLGASNSCTNPILYIYFSRDERHGYLDLLRLGLYFRPVADSGQSCAAWVRVGGCNRDTCNGGLEANLSKATSRTNRKVGDPIEMQPMQTGMLNQFAGDPLSSEGAVLARVPNDADDPKLLRSCRRPDGVKSIDTKRLAIVGLRRPNRTSSWLKNAPLVD